MNMRYIDLTGKRFGNYTVLRRVPSTNNNVKYLCHCDCGTEKIVYASSLRSGKVVSCGCHKNNQCGDNFRKHALRRSTLYGVWSSMKGRCLNPNNQKYSIYGGRGIKVCDEWRNDFKAFYDWAYANGYDENAPKGQCTIDRINVDGNYEPSNCRWVTAKQQSNNVRCNVYITYKGETLTLTEMAERYKISPTQLGKRIKRGWTVEDAIEIPIDKHNKYVTIKKEKR